ncbi:hypothetical protein TWF788_009661 [Orbilia oligospora]|uniref:Uncharacterized protein n=1 Tax=Orbilia oligospora TaxID=2813651 RepID=A0A7C8PKD5_ORBOL|nr:hypothetical protein TWF788_009661 [Orbilia oligospora]
MGQLFSSPYEYSPPSDSNHPPDMIPMLDTIGSRDRNRDGEVFYVDFSDPESLVRELKRYHMVGILISPPSDSPEISKGSLYLIGWDNMPTSLVENEAVDISAVYPASLSHLATLSVGGETLQKRVRGHRSFVSQEAKRCKDMGEMLEHADEGQMQTALKRMAYSLPDC